jgi:hypothetical protein
VVAWDHVHKQVVDLPGLRVGQHVTLTELDHHDSPEYEQRTEQLNRAGLLCQQDPRESQSGGYF